MNIDVVHVNAAQRRVTVEIDAEAVRVRLDRALKTMGRSVNMKGFRQGKVPLSVLRSMFGKRVLQEIAQELVDEHAQQALESLEREPISTPSVEVDELGFGAPLRFALLVDVLPELDSVTLEPLVVRVDPQYAPGAGVSEADVDARLEQARQEQGELVSVEGRGADVGDRVTCALEPLSADDPLLEARFRHDDAEIQLTEDLMDGLLEGLRGMTVGEEREFDVSTERSSESGPPRVLEARVRARMKVVQTVELPDLDDELAKDLGHESLDAWRASVQAGLAEEQVRSSKDRHRDAVTSAMIELNPVEIPPRAVAEMAASAVRNVLGKEVDEQMAQQMVSIFWPMTERSMQFDAITSSLARQWGIEVEPEAVEARMREALGFDDEALSGWREARPDDAAALQRRSAERLARDRATDRLMEMAQFVYEAAPDEDAEGGEAAASNDDPASLADAPAESEPTTTATAVEATPMEASE